MNNGVRRGAHCSTVELQAVQVFLRPVRAHEVSRAVRAIDTTMVNSPRLDCQGRMRLWAPRQHPPDPKPQFPDSRTSLQPVIFSGSPKNVSNVCQLRRRCTRGALALQSAMCCGLEDTAVSNRTKEHDFTSVRNPTELLGDCGPDPPASRPEGAREAISYIDERRGRTMQQAAPSDVLNQLGHLITCKMPLPCSILQTTPQPPDARGFQRQNPSLVIQLKNCEQLL